MKRVELHLTNKANKAIDPINNFDLSNEERARDFASVLNFHIRHICEAAFFFDIRTGKYLQVVITCANDTDAEQIYRSFDTLPEWVTRLGIVPALYLGRPVCAVWCDPEEA